MYIDRLLLPEFSNREDLLVTVSLFDDDTGSPIELSGRTLAAPGNFIGNNWTVTDGAIVTNSVTPLTIPDFPIGNQLTAVAFTVGTNLGILPGDPMTIADATGLNTMSGYVTSYVPATGAIVCQVGMTFQFEIRSGGRGWDCNDYQFYGIDAGHPIITAALGNGLMIVDIGVVQIRVTEFTLRKLHHRTYKASMTMTDSVDTRQIFIGHLPMQRGGVSN
jgi:hypothetical protein